MFALAGTPWLIILGLAAEPYYAAVILADPHQVAVGRIAYGVALAICTVAGLADRRSRGQYRSRPSEDGQRWAELVPPRPLQRPSF